MRPPIAFIRQLIPLEVLRSMRPGILLDPHYQRQGDVWPTGKQQLLIDSILNGFLVPPMYWHALEHDSEYFDGLNRYAVVDGRQRLEAIFGFLAGEVGLSPDVSLLADPALKFGGMSIDDLRRELPWLYAQLMRSEIEVVIIETSDVDLIEELFSRLNEGVPLNAAEKRNKGRILAPKVNELAHSHPFFVDHLPFGNRRYRHLDLLAKFMRLEAYAPLSEGRVPNLRKRELDRLFEQLRTVNSNRSKDQAAGEIDDLLARVSDRLDRLTAVFEHKDRYLGSVGMVTLYYAFDRFLAERGIAELSRADVIEFEARRIDIKHKNEEDYTADERLMYEFSTYAQGPTSGSYLSARLRILSTILRDLDPRQEAEALLAADDE